MQLLKRLFGGQRTAPPAATAASPVPLPTFTIRFADGSTPLAVRAPTDADPQRVLKALHIDTPRPSIFISGGAGLMDRDSMNITRSTIEDGLARFLQDHQVALIDGGTSSGVMLLVGVARNRRSHTFPLIGVAPEKMVGYPNHENPSKIADLDGNHSHFVLTDGDEFGSESPMIYGLNIALSGSDESKRLCLIVNGGEIVKREAHLCATGDAQGRTTPLLVLEGSGRFADTLAAAVQAGHSDDPVIQAVIDKGRVHVLSIKSGAENLYRWLENFFGI